MITETLSNRQRESGINLSVLKYDSTIYQYLSSIANPKGCLKKDINHPH